MDIGSIIEILIYAVAIIYTLSLYESEDSYFETIIILWVTLLIMSILVRGTDSLLYEVFDKFFNK